MHYLKKEINYKFRIILLYIVKYNNNLHIKSYSDETFCVNCVDSLSEYCNTTIFGAQSSSTDQFFFEYKCDVPPKKYIFLNNNIK